MSKKPDPALVDDDAPEWGEREFQRSQGVSHMPADFQQALRRVRGPQKSPTKVQTTIRFDRDVLDALRALGKGWQTQVNATMRDWLRTQRSR